MCQMCLTQGGLELHEQQEMYNTSTCCLQTLASFGFRGEALSSLCAVSELMVTTRTGGDVTGSRVTYDSAGRISSQVSIARSKGTTVALRELFKPLPVRRKVDPPPSLIPAALGNRDACFGPWQHHYGLLLSGAAPECKTRIRKAAGPPPGVCCHCDRGPDHLHKPGQCSLQIITCTAPPCTVTEHAGYVSGVLQIGTGPRMKALSTQGATGMRDNIANVFGPRTVEALMSLEAPLGDVAHASGYVESLIDAVNDKKQQS